MTWISNNLPLIWDRTLAHLAQSVPAILLAAILAIPIGWLAWRVGLLRGPIVGTVGLLYAIPSLPLFVALPVMIGTGRRDPINVVIALTLYGIALQVRAVTDGLDAVPADARNAATAMGYTATRRFLTVELPLAGPVLLAGLRVVAVSTIALTTVGAVLGVPSLGMLFTDGFQRGILAEIVAGLAGVILLALVIDRVLVLAGRALMPWDRAHG